jgi:hypothetical protein
MKIQLRVILIGILFSVSCSLIIIFNDSFAQNVFGTPEDFLVLQTGIISTVDDDFAVSNIFKTRVLQDGKIMRISGITTTGEAYYIYQKIEDDTTVVNGKILVNGVFIPIISKEVVSEPEIQIMPETKLNMAVKIPKYTYSNYPFVISVKVFDIEKNAQPKFEDAFGTLENVFVNVTITNRFDKFVTSLTGYTDSSGLFRGSYLVNEGITGQGEFNVNVVANDGISSTSKSYVTFFRGDIRYYDDNNP